MSINSPSTADTLIEVGSRYFPVIISLGESINKYLPESSERAKILFGSMALWQATFASFKNLPYAFAGRGFWNIDVGYFISSRLNYLQSTLMCVASTVFHVVAAFLYTSLLVGTFGISERVRYQFRKHWAQTAYAIVASGIGLTGMLIPKYGVALNALYLYYEFKLLHRNYRGDLRHYDQPFLNEIRSIYKANKELIIEFVRFKLVNNDTRYHQEFKPVFVHFDLEINSPKLKSIDGLLDILYDIVKKFPAMENKNATTTVTRETITVATPYGKPK